MTQKISVLVIEDPIRGGQTSALLRDAGAHVLTAESCDQAMNRMPEYVDAIVVDSETPGLCARDSLNRLRNRAPMTAVVILGKEDRLDYLQNFRAKGAEGYLALPYARQDLLQTLRDGFLKSRKAAAAPATVSAFDGLLQHAAA